MPIHDCYVLGYELKHMFDYCSSHRIKWSINQDEICIGPTFKWLTAGVWPTAEMIRCAMDRFMELRELPEAER